MCTVCLETTENFRLRREARIFKYMLIFWIATGGNVRCGLLWSKLSCALRDHAIFSEQVMTQLRAKTMNIASAKTGRPRCTSHQRREVHPQLEALDLADEPALDWPYRRHFTVWTPHQYSLCSFQVTLKVRRQSTTGCESWWQRGPWGLGLKATMSIPKSLQIKPGWNFHPGFQMW